MSTNLHKTFMFGDRDTDVLFERYPDLAMTDKETKETLTKEINLLLQNCWGLFPPDFVSQHIFGAQKMIVARAERKCIGICVMSIKAIAGLKIHYVEFLLVDREFQKNGLGTFLFFSTVKEEIIKNILSIVRGRPLEIAFITPNIRVLSSMAKFA